MPLTTFSHVDQLGNRSPDGMLHGSATTDLIGFYGIATPVAQRAAGNNTAVTSGMLSAASSSVLQEIQTTLINLGIMPAT